MLSNSYFLAKFRFAMAENEPTREVGPSEESGPERQRTDRQVATLEQTVLAQQRELESRASFSQRVPPMFDCVGVFIVKSASVSEG